MRLLSFILVILGGILCFSEAAEVLGIILIILGFILNIYHHLSKAAMQYHNSKFDRK